MTLSTYFEKIFTAGMLSDLSLEEAGEAGTLARLISQAETVTGVGKSFCILHQAKSMEDLEAYLTKNKKAYVLVNSAFMFNEIEYKLAPVQEENHVNYVLTF